MDINIDKIIDNLNELEIDEKEKKLFLDLLQNIQSPIKFDYDTLDDKLKPFFQRNKNYYLFLEKYFKNSISNLEMIKKFLKEIDIRKKVQNGNYLRFTSFSRLMKYMEGDKITEKIIFGNTFKAIKKEYLIDKNHHYSLQYNLYLLQKIYYEFVLFGGKFNCMPYYLNTNYILEEDFFKFLINGEKGILKQLKKLINMYDIDNKKTPLKVLLDKAYRDINNIEKFEYFEKKLTRGDYIRYMFETIQTYIKDKTKFLKYTNFFELFDKLNKEDKLKLIREFEKTLEDLSLISTNNLKIAIKNIRETNYSEGIKEAFIEYLVNTNSYRHFLSFGDSTYPNSKKFYFELDFSLPEDLVIEQSELP